HTRFSRDWSSDVCSSDLRALRPIRPGDSVESARHVDERADIMPGRRNSSLKDPELYEELRDDGASKQKAARISNAAAARGRSAEIGRAACREGVKYVVAP